MKTARILFWARTPHDSRDTAGDTGSVRVRQRDALQLARDIDIFGQTAIDRAGEKILSTTLKPGSRAAAGHGVEIQYASGRSRQVSHD